MRLSKTAWNNVIIFSVMIIILFINMTNERLFSNNDVSENDRLLPEHSVVLTLSITLVSNKNIQFERVGTSWKMTSQGVVVDLNNQQIEQLMFAWQQASGLVQASDIMIDGQQGIEVFISLASIEHKYQFTLYPLTDQLLVYNHSQKLWLSFPAALSHQLIPIS